MRVFWLVLGCLSLGGFSLSAVSRADAAGDLAEYVADRVSAVEQAVTSCDASAGATAGNDESWFYRRFWLRLQPRAAFSVTGIVKVDVFPEVEVLWERPLPQGWAVYQPQ